MQRYKITIRGKVQQVGFRRFLEDKANELDLSGFVMNVDDDKVLTEVQGNPHALAKFLIYCAEGPPRAFVNSLSIEEVPTIDGEHQFNIRYPERK